MYKGKFGRSLALVAVLACASIAAVAQTASVRDYEVRGYQAMRGTSNIGAPQPTLDACKALFGPDAIARKASSLYKCRQETVYTVTYSAAPPPVVCPAARAPLVEQIACPSGTTGTQTRTTTYVMGPPNACVESATVGPVVGTCTPVVTPPPPPTGTGPTYYFSDCQTGAASGCAVGSNANPGTSPDAPKQNLAGVNLNALPAGTRLLLKRGGAWTPGMLTIDNPNVSAASPLAIDAYGSGPSPVLRQCSGNLFNLGGGWGNTTNDGGYTIRNVKMDGCGTAEWAVWFVLNVRDVVLENNEITGFRIAINSNDGTPYGVSGVTIRNNNIHHNRSMGLLGHYDNFLLEGNLIEANNFTGSPFDHGTYIGGGHNVTLRNNRFVRNSVCATAPCYNGNTPNATLCTGGNMTFHGQIEGLVIEGNEVEQDAAAPSCYGVSITRGYATAEWFRDTVVRNNVIKNIASGVVAQSAPGIRVEGNVAISSGFSIGSGSTPGSGGDEGDVGDTDAVVQNNTLCRRSGSAGVSVNSLGAVVTNNLVRTGTDATTGVCAR